MTLLKIITVLVAITTTIVAHPVIWKGGNAMMLSVDNKLYSATFHHSINYNWSLGARYMGHSETDQDYTFVQSNWLLKRWNQRFSQGNLYLMSGFGLEHSESQGVPHIGLQGDWETRKVYTYASTQYYGFDEEMLVTRMRLGIAPYVAGFEDLHTWLILQLDQELTDENSLTSLIPVLRLFKDNLLFEFGTNGDDRHFFAAMLHI